MCLGRGLLCSSHLCQSEELPHSRTFEISHQEALQLVPALVSNTGIQLEVSPLIDPQKYFFINPFKVFGALLIALPIISLFANLTIDNLDIHEDSRRNFFMNLLVVTLIHFCNFTQVNFKAFDILTLTEIYLFRFTVMSSQCWQLFLPLLLFSSWRIPQTFHVMRISIRQAYPLLLVSLRKRYISKIVFSINRF